MSSAEVDQFQQCIDGNAATPFPLSTPRDNLDGTLSAADALLMPCQPIGAAMCQNIRQLPLAHDLPRYQVFVPSPEQSASIPPALYPTALQGIVPHIQYVDAIPFATLRDSLLQQLRLGAFDEVEFCQDLLNGGFQIWGTDPAQPLAWEIADAFAKKWSWLIDDSILDIAKFWAGQRKQTGLPDESVDALFA